MADQLKVAQTTSHCSDKTRNLFDSSNITKITQYNTLHVVYVRRLIICPRLHQQHINVSKRLPLASSPKYFNQSPNRRERERGGRREIYVSNIGKCRCRNTSNNPHQFQKKSAPSSILLHPPPSSSSSSSMAAFNNYNQQKQRSWWPIALNAVPAMTMIDEGRPHRTQLPVQNRIWSD